MWQMYFLKIPRVIEAKFEQLNEQGPLAIYCLKELSEEDIRSGMYEHVGIFFNSEAELIFPETIVPAVTGRYSKKNAEDWEIVRKDLPMEEYSITFDAPNFGDITKGTHEVTWDKERYKRELVPAKGMSISITRVREDATLFKFEVEREFEYGSDDFFFGLNLLQEAVGACDIRVASEEIDLRPLEQLQWQVFPPGEREEFARRVLEGIPEQDRQKIDVTQERINFMDSLKSVGYVYGITGLGHYFGAKITEEVVVFENRDYGNAVYVLFGDWRELSRLSRTELLNRHGSDEYRRVVHKDNWQSAVIRILEEKIPGYSEDPEDTSS